MSAIEWALLIGFVVPIVVLCTAFVVLAVMMTDDEEGRKA